MAASGKAPPFSIAYGVARDYAAFFSALVPRQKTAVAPRAVVPLCDTVLLVKGKPQRWLYSVASTGEATEKLTVDKDAVLTAFKQQGGLSALPCAARASGWAQRQVRAAPRRRPRCRAVCALRKRGAPGVALTPPARPALPPRAPAALASPANFAKLVSIVRRSDGTYEVLNAEDSAAFLAASETGIGSTAVAIQVRAQRGAPPAGARARRARWERCARGARAARACAGVRCWR